MPLVTLTMHPSNLDPLDQDMLDADTIAKLAAFGEGVVQPGMSFPERVRIGFKRLEREWFEKELRAQQLFQRLGFPAPLPTRPRDNDELIEFAFNVPDPELAADMNVIARMFG
jgi:hypothetical protein